MDRVLFVCEHGAGKSVVAAAHFNRMAQDAGLSARAIARGPVPDAAFTPEAVAGLAEDGLRPVGDAPVLLTAADAVAATRIITLGPLSLGGGVRPIESWTEVPAVSDGYARACEAMFPALQRLVGELSASEPRAGVR